MTWRDLVVVILLLISTSAQARDGLVHQYDRSVCPTSALFDEHGAALVDYGPPLGRRHNPVTVSQYAIACERSFQLTHQRKFWRIFAAQIRYLKDRAIVRGPDLAYYEYDFPWPGYDLTPGWRSGLAQGLAISALIRYYRDTGDRMVLPLLSKLKAGMLTSKTKGGLVQVSPDGKLWIEEFPSDPPSFVLNGFISAVFGLYEYTRLFPKDGAAHEELSDALAGLKLSLPAYDTGNWALLDRRAPPYPRANDNYMGVYTEQLQTLAEITGDPFFAYMGLRWNSFLNDVHVHLPGNTEQQQDGAYRVRPEFPVILPADILRDNVESIESTSTYDGFGTASLLHPRGGTTSDYESYFAPSEEGSAFIQIRLRRNVTVNTLVLGLYNVDLYPLDLKILVRDEAGPWRAVDYERGSDRRHFAYYFPDIHLREMRLEATRFHGQNRLILSTLALGSAAKPRKAAPTFGSFLSAPVSLEGLRFGVRIDAPPKAEHEIVVMYRHSTDLTSLDSSPWELDFIDPLRPNQHPVRDRLYQFRVLYTAAAIAAGWKKPVVLVDGKPIEINPVSSEES